MDKKIVLLSRISTGDQSLESQTNDLIKEAIRLGYSIDNQIIIETVESAIKLSEEERIGLQKLKQYIETGEVDSIICWEPSRLSRQQKTLYSIRDYLINKKIQLYCLNPYFKLLNDDRTQIDTTANIVFSLFSVISENEMTLKKSRFARAKNELRNQNKKFAGAVIFGYMKDENKKCIPHPLYGKIIQELFHHYINNECSLYDTYMWANKNWPETFPIVDYMKAAHTINHLLSKEVYWKGNWCYDPLVSNEIGEKCQEKKHNAQAKPRYMSKKQYLARGKCTCGHCGRIMTGIGGNVNAYYCSTDRQHRLQVNIEAIDFILWEECRTAINIGSTFDNTKIIFEAKQNLETKFSLKEQYETKLEDTYNKQSKLLNLYLNGKINDRLYNEKNDKLEEEIQLYKKNINKIKIEIDELNITLDNLKNKPLTTNNLNVDNITDFNLKLEYVKKYIDRIICTKQDDGNVLIEVTFNFPIITAKSKYIYCGKGGSRKIYRINQDEIVDRIF